MAEASSFASNAYANAFVPGKPRDTAKLVQERLRKAKLFNEELADYFAARRELEESYLKQLQKISKRSFLSDASTIPPGYAPVYERLIQELSEVANVHSELEKVIADDCEAAIRSASTKGEWSRMKEHDDSLANTLREINSLEAQLNKDLKKVEAASSKKAGQANAKMQETEQALAQTMEVWQTEAPFAFESYQRIDAQRLELLKEVVAKFETAQSDAAQRVMGISEKSMQECLSFDTQADMQSFVLKNASAGALSGSTARNGSSARAPTTTTPAALQRSGSTAGRSVNSRTGAAPAASRNNGAGMGEFGRSTTSIHSADRTAGSINESTPSKSGGSTLRSAFSRFGRGRSNKDSSANTQTTYGSLADQPGNASFSSSTSRNNFSDNAGTVRQSAAPSHPLGSVGEDSLDFTTPAAASGLMAPLTPSAAPMRKNSAPRSPAPLPAQAPQVDAEGYSIPPPDRKPWESTAPTAGGASLMDDDAEDSRDTFDTSLGSRVTNMNISSQPIAEDSDKDRAAMERVKSALLTTGGPPSRRGTTRRDRRDVRNTTYNPAFAGVGSGEDGRMSQFGVMTASPASSIPGSPSPFGTSTTQNAGLPSAIGRARTQSIASVSSSTNPFDSSSSSAPLKASLTERVNVIFNGREITKVMVVGELSVSVTGNAAASEPLHIRIEAFEQLEKAAPNPSFLQPLPDASAVPGEYLLDLKALYDQGTSSGLPGSGSQAVILKYQLYVSESKKEQYVPLQLQAQWRCEPQQTSFLMTYSPNPSCLLHSSAATGGSVGGFETDPPVLQDLQFAVQIQPSTVTNIMSKPTATFSAENKSLFWKINDNLALTSATSEVSKLLARCQISGAQTTPAPVYLKWKIMHRTISSIGITAVTPTAASEVGVKIGEVVRQCTAGKFIASP